MRSFMFSLVFVAAIVALSPVSAMAGRCSPAQRQQARENLANIEQLAHRAEVVESSVWYRWREGWHSLGPDGQRKITQAILDTEACASDGKIAGVFIEYNGHTVAKATLYGGVTINP